VDELDQRSRTALYTAPFLALCLIAFLGFAQSFVLQPVLPLLVLDLGGDAALVGVALGVFSIPSIVLRPFIGRLVDRWGQARIMFLGTAGTALSAALYLVPTLAVLIPVRVFHGVFWAGFTTGSTSTLARLAPQTRRLEASGVFDLMPSLAALTMPAASLLILDALGFSGPLVLAASLGAAAALVTLVVFRPWQRRPTTAGSPSTKGPWLEPAALQPMVMVLLFTSAASLFLVYPPLIAVERGIPITDLAIYYVIYGVVLATMRGTVGRVFERTSRVVILAAAAVLAAVGLVIGAFAATLPLMVLAATIFAVAYGLAPPTAQAVVMERAPRARLGAAMATYTLGFQIGSGLGAAIWGFLISPLGFTNVFILAAGIQLLLLVLVLRRRLDSAPPEPAGDSSV
jgi:predicted MFS family arabinose efflux permease